MKALAATWMALVLVGACTKRESRTFDTGARQALDTTIVRHDTKISVDTARKRGVGPARTDTLPHR